MNLFTQEKNATKYIYPLTGRENFLHNGFAYYFILPKDVNIQGHNPADDAIFYESM